MGRNLLKEEEKLKSVDQFNKERKIEMGLPALGREARQDYSIMCYLIPLFDTCDGIGPYKCLFLLSSSLCW